MPVVQLQIMNNSTGYTPFQLRFGQTPQILPPIINPLTKASSEYISVKEIIETLANDVADAKDNLMLAKITQLYQGNKNCRDDIVYKPGDQVMLSTLNRR